MGISRRSVIFASTSALLCLSLFPAAAQAKPIALRLVRRTGWEELMGRNQCVIGDLYLTDLSFPLADAGTKITQNDCMTFMSSVAASLKGVHVPTRGVTELPLAYLRRLIDSN